MTNTLPSAEMASAVPNAAADVGLDALMYSSCCHDELVREKTYAAPLNARLLAPPTTCDPSTPLPSLDSSPAPIAMVLPSLEIASALPNKE